LCALETAIEFVQPCGVRTERNRKLQQEIQWRMTLLVTHLWTGTWSELNTLLYNKEFTDFKWTYLHFVLLRERVTKWRW